MSLVRLLREWVRRDEISCHFSGTLLGEIAPLNSSAKDLARRRFELLIDLCGHNALISQDRLVAAEFSYALGLTQERVVAHSASADWHPSSGLKFSEILSLDAGLEIKKLLHQENLPRAARRRAERQLLKHGEPKKPVREQIIQRNRQVSLEELQRLYPIRPEYAQLMFRYMAGDASSAEVDVTFLESLRDLRWIVDWLCSRPEQPTPFLEWVRGPSAMVLQGIVQLQIFATKTRSDDQERGTALSKGMLSRSRWLDMQDQWFVNIATSIVTKTLKIDTMDLDTRQIDSGCPGFSTGLRTLFSAWWQSIVDAPRTPLASDYLDAMHAMYAPYVDVFRTDAFMAPHVTKFTKSRTSVISKLSELAAVIQRALDSKAGP